jgi:phage terminase large subunit-like protein
VSAEFLLARQREAVRNTREQGRFKTKHLNLWVNARAAYFNMQSWTACRNPELRLEDFEGQRCKIALDLASKQDIAAMQILFDLGDGSFATFGRYYLPEDVVEEPGKDHYRGWALADPPKLILTQGNMIDFGRIEEDLDDIRRKYTVEEITFDPAQATMLMTRLMAKGANVSEFQQTAANFTEPMKQVAALIDAGRLKHNCDANDPMTWMMSNVTARLDGKDQVFPRKERPENKIDGPVALIMTMRLAMIEVPPINIATLIA